LLVALETRGVMIVLKELALNLKSPSPIATDPAMIDLSRISLSCL
jgi:hypothetical protein